MAFNATFNKTSVISWRSLLLVEDTGGPTENHWPVASHSQSLSHNVVHLALRDSVVIGTDCIGSCKSNYQMITSTMALTSHWEIPVILKWWCTFTYGRTACAYFTNSGPSCLWSHSRWIFNYLCNQCISPLNVTRCARYNIMW